MGTIRLTTAQALARYFDRIAWPEQLLDARPRATRVLTDPAECGPVTLAPGADPIALARRHRTRITRVHCENARWEAMAETRRDDRSFLEARSTACSRCRAMGW
jgi:hypothetical protein